MPVNIYYGGGDGKIDIDGAIRIVVIFVEEEVKEVILYSSKSHLKCFQI